MVIRHLIYEIDSTQNLGDNPSQALLEKAKIPISSYSPNWFRPLQPLFLNDELAGLFAEAPSHERLIAGCAKSNSQ